MGIWPPWVDVALTSSALECCFAVRLGQLPFQVLCITHKGMKSLFKAPGQETWERALQAQ